MQLSAEVGRPSCQDERDKDSLSVLSSDDVEPQTGGASVDQNSARLPGGERGKWTVVLSMNSTNLHLVLFINIDCFGVSCLVLERSGIEISAFSLI